MTGRRLAHANGIIEEEVKSNGVTYVKVRFKVPRVKRKT